MGYARNIRLTNLSFTRIVSGVVAMFSGGTGSGWCRHILRVDPWNKGDTCLLLPVVWISGIENHTFFITLVSDMIVFWNIKDIPWTAALRLTIASQAKDSFHTVNNLIAR